MVELRKRKAPAEAAPPPAPKKNSNPVKKAVDKAKEVVIGESAKATNGTEKLAVGDTISLDGFGGEIETHSGEKISLKKLVDDSKAGVVLFTYPKASTPGCECFTFLTGLSLPFQPIIKSYNQSSIELRFMSDLRCLFIAARIIQHLLPSIFMLSSLSHQVFVPGRIAKPKYW